MIRSATLENILADKITTCHRFKSGNTRMKDFDDLWRLSRCGQKIDARKLSTLLKSPAQLDIGWITPEIQRNWSAHRLRYKDLPKDLVSLFNEVNTWLLRK